MAGEQTLRVYGVYKGIEYCENALECPCCYTELDHIAHGDGQYTCGGCSLGFMILSHISIPTIDQGALLIIWDEVPKA